jgi:HTH-type transcriptional regulator/antitoxin HigA
MNRLIKNETDYREVLTRIDRLMATAKSGTPDGEELELLVTLVELYEKDVYPVPPPTPVEAIAFRMDQMGMTPRDLIPYMGTKSRVSEVLSGKRPLTLSMIRALHKHLGIPAETLLQSGEGLPREPQGLDWSRFPLKEMVARGMFSEIRKWSRTLAFQAEELIRGLYARTGGGELCSPETCFRQGMRRNAKADPYAVQAWVLSVRLAAGEVDCSTLGRFDPEKVDYAFFKRVAQLSALSTGPQLAKEMLATRGIILVIVPHFNKTYLDGGAMLLKDGTPVIALTLRYDRVDYFWFSLLHELAHVGRHLRGENGMGLFLDDLDIAAVDGAEAEADSIATEAAVPAEALGAHPVSSSGSAEDVRDLAGKLGIHPAIVAGRLRHDRGDYRMLSKLVGHGQVHKLFAEETAMSR